jgi:hypothetical protein
MIRLMVDEAGVRRQRQEAWTQMKEDDEKFEKAVSLKPDQCHKNDPS